MVCAPWVSSWIRSQNAVIGSEKQVRLREPYSSLLRAWSKWISLQAYFSSAKRLAAAKVQKMKDGQTFDRSEWSVANCWVDLRLVCSPVLIPWNKCSLIPHT